MLASAGSSSQHHANPSGVEIINLSPLQSLAATVSSQVLRGTFSVHESIKIDLILILFCLYYELIEGIPTEVSVYLSALYVFWL